MSLPESLQRGLRPLPARSRQVATTQEGVAAHEIPGFAMQPQEQEQWCWAAVTCSIARFYDAKTEWSSQCRLVNEILERQDCCGAAIAAECNVQWFLDLVLEKLGLLKRWTTDLVTFEEVRAEIDANRPVACRIVWKGEGAHFVAIVGYDRDTVLIEDPFNGSSAMNIDTFRNNYLGLGTWKDTTETQAKPRGPKRRAVRS